MGGTETVDHAQSAFAAASSGNCLPERRTALELGNIRFTKASLTNKGRLAWSVKKDLGEPDIRSSYDPRHCGRPRQIAHPILQPHKEPQLTQIARLSLVTL